MNGNRMISLLKQVNAYLDQYGKEVMLAEDEDLTLPQSFLLGYLLESGKDEFCAAVICRETGISKATVSGLFKELRQKGYIEMEFIPEDGRRKRILLTPKTLEARKRIRGLLARRRDCLCRGISEGDLAVIENGLTQMSRNLKEEHNQIRRNRHDTNTAWTGRGI